MCLVQPSSWDPDLTWTTHRVTLLMGPHMDHPHHHLSHDHDVEVAVPPATVGQADVLHALATQALAHAALAQPSREDLHAPWRV